MLRGFLLLFALSVLTLSFAPKPTVRAEEDFEGREDEYYELCESEELAGSDIQVCREFRSYLSEKQKDLDAEISANEDKIASLSTELEEVYIMISDVQHQMAEQQQKIDVLNAEIGRLEDSIAEKDGRIRERMYVLQSTVNSNAFLEFLMGSVSLDDFFGRMASIDEMTEYDQDLIAGLNDDKKEVEESRAQEQAEQDRLAQLKQQHDELAEALASQISEMEAENFEANEQSAEYQEQMASINESIQQALENSGGYIDGPVSSAGFSQPVQWGIVTAANWQYPDGGIHMGMDIGGMYGSNLFAPCDALVIYYSGGCQSDGGYLGNYCNGGAGNYMVMITEMNGTTYGIRYLHMIDENFLGWSSGDIIEVGRGEVIGHMGHSGSSTGTHVHIDIVNLGDIGYTEAARRFASYGSFFGVSSTYSNRCSVKGIPCREEASAMFGYSLYQEIGSRY